MEHSLTPAVYRRLLQMQHDEIMGSILYVSIAKRQKNESNKAVLLEIAAAEREHYELWKSYTRKDIAPSKCKLVFFQLLNRIMGDTFTIKFLEKREEFSIKELRQIEHEIAEVQTLIEEEEEHESKLLAMIDEERLHYIGAMVLGLNDALVELTGTIAGLTFALGNTRLVALSAIITGISATLSMAASNYLAERANGNANALKSSVYTGMAYLITVALMVLPFLLLPNTLSLAALGIMLLTVVLIILLFNYYIAIVQDLPFLRRFGEMALISLGVAAVSFVIGILAKSMLGIDL